MSVSSYPRKEAHPAPSSTSRSPSDIYRQHQNIKHQAELPHDASQHAPLAEAVRISPLLHTPLVAIDPEDTELLGHPTPSTGSSSPSEEASPSIAAQPDQTLSVVDPAHRVSLELQDFYRRADRHSTPILTTFRPQVGPVSRPMAIARRFGPDFLFLASSVSATAWDVQASPSVMLAFFDDQSEDWTSVLGEAMLTGHQDRRIDECWYPGLQAWLVNLGDGVHTGRPGDPRLCCLEVRTIQIVNWSGGNYVEIEDERLRYAREVARSRG